MTHVGHMVGVETAMPISLKCLTSHLNHDLIICTIMETGCMPSSSCKSLCDKLSTTAPLVDRYKTHAWCTLCRKHFKKVDLAPTKNGAKILCPCCKTYARRTPTTSARNRTIKRRANA